MSEICLLNDSFPPIIDGVANTVTNYARVIRGRGGDVSVVTPDCPGADDSVFDYPVLRYPSIELQKFYGYSAGNPFPIPTLLELKKHDIDLLHCHCPAISCVVTRELREFIKAPFVLTYHTKFDQDIDHTFKGQIAKDVAIKALVENVSACDELWVVSRGAGENIKSLGYRGDYVVMENGVDMPRKRATRAQVEAATKNYDLPKGVPVFLFVGRLMWYKGIQIILDALAALNSQDLDYRMVFIGGGADEKEIKAYARKLKLGKKVIFTGPMRDRDKMVAWYTRANLFLFPSTFDTNGLVVREAAACGLGSVLIKDSCASEGVTNILDGLMVEENAASLAVCLARVMDNFDLMKRLGKNASENIYISWDDAVEKALERYEIVIDNYRSGKYRKRKRISDEIFTLSGDMLNTHVRMQERIDKWSTLVSELV